MKSLDAIRASQHGDLLVSANGDRRSRLSWTGRLWFRNYGTYPVLIVSKTGWQVNQLGSTQAQLIYGTNTVESPGGGAANAWHRIVYGYDAGRESIFVSLDAGARSYRKLFHSSPPFDVTPDPRAAFIIRGNFGGTGTGSQILDIDEVGLWQDKVWTATESTDDWNGGAGRAYAASPEGATAYWSLESYTTTVPDTLTDDVSGYVLTQNGAISSIQTGHIGDCLQLTPSGVLPSSFDGVIGDVEIGGE